MAMETRVDEIADKIYRFSTLIPGVAGPAGLTFNQFLIDADEPLLFHTGQRPLFPSISAAAARVIDISRLRWITFLAMSNPTNVARSANGWRCSQSYPRARTDRMQHLAQRHV